MWLPSCSWTPTAPITAIYHSFLTEKLTFAAPELWIYCVSLSHTPPQHADHNVGTSPLNLPCLQCQLLAYTSFPQLPLADCVKEKEGWNLKLRGIAYYSNPQQELEFSHLPSTLMSLLLAPVLPNAHSATPAAWTPPQLNHCPPTWQVHNFPEQKICFRDFG